MDKLFKTKRERYRRSYRGSCWFNNFLCNELYSLCKPQMLSQTGMPAQGVFLATIIVQLLVPDDGLLR